MMTPVQAAATSGERNMRWVSYRERAIKYRNGLDDSEKTYLCPWNRGCLPDYVLQSTPVSNKTQNLDKSQLFQLIISIIEST